MAIEKKKHGSRISAVKIRALRSLGTTLDRIRNSVVREQAGVKVDIVIRIEKSVLSCFGRLERIDEKRITKQIYVGWMREALDPEYWCIMKTYVQRWTDDGC